MNEGMPDRKLICHVYSPYYEFRSLIWGRHIYCGALLIPVQRTTESPYSCSWGLRLLRPTGAEAPARMWLDEPQFPWREPCEYADALGRLRVVRPVHRCQVPVREPAEPVRPTAD